MPVNETTAERPDDRMPPLGAAQEEKLGELIERLDPDTLYEVIGERADDDTFPSLLHACRHQQAPLAGSALITMVREYVYAIHRAEIDTIGESTTPGGEYAEELRLDNAERAQACNEART